MKRKEIQLEYREKRAEYVMYHICREVYKIDIPNHAVKDAYRFGFDEGVKWADHNPFGVIDEVFAWNIYNFINKWKNGDFGELPLQRALRDFGKEMIP